MTVENQLITFRFLDGEASMKRAIARELFDLVRDLLGDCRDSVNVITVPFTKKEYDEMICAVRSKRNNAIVLESSIATICHFLQLTIQFMDTRSAMNQLVQQGKIAAVGWAHKSGCEWDKRTCAIAALYGRFEVLKWLHMQGCPWDERTCAAAAYNGHLPILQWACANGCPCDDWVSACAAYGGHLESLQWLHDNGCICTSWICSCAAYRGHLEILQWWQELSNDCNEWTCMAAAYGGQLDTLKWLHAIGCPWDIKTCVCAAYGGHDEILQWLRANGCPWNDFEISQAREAGEPEFLQCFQGNPGLIWAYIHHCGGSMEIPEYFRHKSRIWRHWKCEYFWEDAHIEILKYLRVSMRQMGH